ncbi:MAG: hypothetical protein CMI12_01475 [Oceanospirillum sp.]|nr:hypothetical protein [Oceanospirillum sp.]
MSESIGPVILLTFIFAKRQFRKSQQIKPLPALMLLCLLGTSQPVFSGFFSSSQSSNSNLSNSQQRFLPVEEAFQLSGQLKEQQLILNWRIEPEHYLYRSRFNIRLLEPRTLVLSGMDIPRGEKTHDEFLGEVEILRHQVSIQTRLNISEQLLNQGVVIEVTFQGCADAGLCYPPHRQILNLVPQR